MKSALNGAVLFLTLFFDFATSKLHLSHTSATKEENQSFAVICSDPDNGSKMTWRGLRNKPISYRNGNLFVKMGAQGLSLVFSKVRKEDEGTYLCTSDTDRIEFHLDVSASIEFMDTPVEVSGKQGTDIMLKCDAKNAQVQFQVDGAKPANESKYRVLADAMYILNAVPEDSRHHYACKAFNYDLGTLKTRNITVSVQHPPRPKYAKHEVVYGYIDGQVNLTCAVEAEPPPKFRWFLKERHKTVGRIFPNARASVLTVIIRDARDLGEYKCEAANSEGTYELSFTLELGVQPPPPDSLEIQGANSTAITMYIEGPNVTTETNMEPTGFLVQYRPLEESYWSSQNFKIAEDKTYVLTNLTSNTTYQVRVATLNPAGPSAYTNETEYTTASSAIVSATVPNLYILCVVLLTSEALSVKKLI